MYNEKTIKFIEKANILHKNKYDYSKVTYISAKEKVILICKTHGEFLQSPDNHLQGKEGCKSCHSENMSKLQRKPFEKFINKAMKIHKNKYDYSQAEYLNNRSIIKIICKTHGVFYRQAQVHLSGIGCPVCESNKKEFIRNYFIRNYKWLLTKQYKGDITYLKKLINNLISYKASCNSVHGHKYDYSQTVLVKATDIISIICPLHGEFKQRANNHKFKAGCPFCADLKLGRNLLIEDKQKFLKDRFYKKLNKKFKNKYILDFVNFVDYTTPVELICRLHGVFKIKPNYLFSGGECPTCQKQVFKDKLKKEFISKANSKYRHKYDYSKVSYTSSKDYVEISCPSHGIFKQKPISHLEGEGCPYCGANISIENKRVSMARKFINRAKELHKDKYTYNLVNYKSMKEKVTIICPIHGEFKQTPDHHSRGMGCPNCNLLISKGVQKIEEYLKGSTLRYEREYKFKNCKFKKALPFDFAIFLEGNLLGVIEYDGEQHFKPVEFFGGKRAYHNQVARDKIKDSYCELENIPLLRIRFDEEEFIEDRLEVFIKVLLNKGR